MRQLRDRKQAAGAACGSRTGVRIVHQMPDRRKAGQSGNMHAAYARNSWQSSAVLGAERLLVEAAGDAAGIGPPR